MSTLEQAFNTARQRVLAGETLTIDEQRELVMHLRANRFNAAETSVASKSKAKAVTQSKKGVSDAELADQLGDLGL